MRHLVHVVERYEDGKTVQSFDGECQANKCTVVVTTKDGVREVPHKRIAAFKPLPSQPNPHPTDS